MSRKVFISFLGTSFYEKTYYYVTDEDKNSVSPTRFAQIASLEKYATDFSKEDKILIFTTEKALQNWEDNTHHNWKKEKVFYRGLKSRLADISMDIPYDNIMIPDGSSPEEIWEIFTCVFKHIEDNDDIIFDITHGFRSLPMLNMVLINYAKLLRNINVSGIYYGAYEAKEKIDGKTFSPIWDLIDFERLQEWTNAAQMFLKAGAAENLSQMMQERNIVGHEEIKNFSREILTNRGIPLTAGISAIPIKNILLDDKNKEIHPVVKPIFELIKKQFVNYEENNVLNGLYAVKWCIDHDLIQQAYTLMSEFLPTYILTYIGYEIDDKNARNTVNGFLGINGKKEKFRFNEVIKDKQIDILNKVSEIPYLKDLCKRSRSINPQNRDDINHGGFRKNPKDYNSFKEELEDKYEKLKNLILKIENEK